MAQRREIDEILENLKSLELLPSILEGASAVHRARNNQEKNEIKRVEAIRAQYAFKEQRRRGQTSTWKNFKADKFGDPNKGIIGGLASKGINAITDKIPFNKQRKEKKLARERFEEEIYKKFAREKQKIIDDAEKEKIAANKEKAAAEKAEQLRIKLAEERAAERAAIQQERDARRQTRIATNGGGAGGGNADYDELEQAINDVHEEIQELREDQKNQSKMHLDILKSQFADTEKEEAHARGIAGDGVESTEKSKSYLAEISADMKSLVDCMDCQLGGRGSKGSGGGAGGSGGPGLLDMAAGAGVWEALKKMFGKGTPIDADNVAKNNADMAKRRAEAEAKKKAVSEKAEKEARDKLEKEAREKLAKEAGENVAKRGAGRALAGVGGRAIGGAGLALIEGVIDNSKEMAETGGIAMDPQIQKIKDGVDTLLDSQAGPLELLNGIFDVTGGGAGVALSALSSVVGEEITKATGQAIEDYKETVITGETSKFVEDSPVQGSGGLGDVVDDLTEKFSELSTWASSIFGMDSGAKPEPKPEPEAKPINQGTVTQESRYTSEASRRFFAKRDEMKARQSQGQQVGNEPVIPGADLSKRQMSAISTALSMDPNNRDNYSAELLAQYDKQKDEQTKVDGIRDSGGKGEGGKTYGIGTTGEIFTPDSGNEIVHLNPYSFFTPKENGSFISPDNNPINKTSNLLGSDRFNSALNAGLDLPNSTSASLAGSGKSLEMIKESAQEMHEAALLAEHAANKNLTAEQRREKADADLKKMYERLITGDFASIADDFAEGFEKLLLVGEDALGLKEARKRIMSHPDGIRKGIVDELNGNRWDLNNAGKASYSKEKSGAKAGSLTNYEERAKFGKMIGFNQSDADTKKLIDAPSGLLDNLGQNAYTPNITNQQAITAPAGVFDSIGTYNSPQLNAAPSSMSGLPAIGGMMPGGMPGLGGMMPGGMPSDVLQQNKEIIANKNKEQTSAAIANNIGSMPVGMKPSVAAHGPGGGMMGGGGGGGGMTPGGILGMGGSMPSSGIPGISTGGIAGNNSSVAGVSGTPSVGGGIPGTTTSTGMPNITGAPSKMANVIDTDASRVQSAVGIDKAHYDTFRGTVAQIESGGKYNIKGGSSGKFDGAYQMVQAAQQDAAKALGIKMPTREEFRANPELQEKMFDAYTAKNNSYLMKNEKYAAMSPEKKMEVLGYAHNQGAGGASKYLRTGKAQSDAFGTVATKYSKAISGNYAALDKQGTSTAGAPTQPGAGTPVQGQMQPVSGSAGATGPVGGAALGGTSQVGYQPTAEDKKYFTNTEKLRGMDPGTVAKMRAAAQETGKVIPLTSGFRSQAHQDSLYAKSDKSGKMVAKTSMHTAGVATDIGGAGKGADAYWKQNPELVAAMEKQGMYRPMDYESWHWEDKSKTQGKSRKGLAGQLIKDRENWQVGGGKPGEQPQGQLQPQPGQQPGSALAGAQAAPQSQADMLAAQTAGMGDSQSDMLTEQTADMGGETAPGSGQLSAAPGGSSGAAVAAAGSSGGGGGGGGGGDNGAASSQPGIGTLGGAPSGGGTASGSSPTDTSNAGNSVQRITDAMMIYGMA